MRTLSQQTDRNSDNQSGQSAVEYLVILTALLIIVPLWPSIYQQFSHTMQDKYSSYAFAVSISDPPSKTFDDNVKKDTGKVGHFLKTLKDIGEVLKQDIFGSLIHGKMPDKNALKTLLKLVKGLF